MAIPAGCRGLGTMRPRPLHHYAVTVLCVPLRPVPLRAQRAHHDTKRCFTVNAKDPHDGQQDEREGGNKAPQYHGVSWVSSSNKWHAEIRKDGMKFNLGFFSDEVLAARVYDAAALALMDGNVQLNFPNDTEASIAASEVLAAEREQQVASIKTSLYRGVTWDPSVKKWRATVRGETKFIELGFCDDEVLAAQIHDAGVLARNGDRALLNFPADMPASGDDAVGN